MAHTVLGIDLGSYSVKVAELVAGFRQTQLTGMFELRLLPRHDEESDLDQRLRTLEQLISDEKLIAEMAATALCDNTSFRLLPLPFSDPKKIEQVLGFELESQVMDDLDSLVVDSVIAKPSATGSVVLAVSAPKQDVRALIAGLSQHGCEPRLVGAPALALAALRGQAFSDAEPIALVDFGHRHTQLCVVHQGAVRFARTIGRGGEALTRLFAEKLQLPFEVAEQIKHETSLEQMTPQASLLLEAYKPLLRELRQTLAAYSEEGDEAPTRMLISGGTAQQSGFAELIGQKLEVSVERLDLASAEVLSPTCRENGNNLAQVASSAVGLALAVAQPMPQVNLRRGELSYRSDYSFLRGKAKHLAVAAALLLVFGALDAVASLRTLKKQEAALEARLRNETVELFGEPRLDGKAISEELRKGPHGGVPPLPELTAFDILDELSKNVPAPDKGKLDVRTLEIKPKQLSLDGYAESAQQVDDLIEALKWKESAKTGVKCFKDIQKGKVSTITVPPTGDNPKGDKPSEMKQFGLTISHTCL